MVILFVFICLVYLPFVQLGKGYDEETRNGTYLVFSIIALFTFIFGVIF